MKHGVLLGVALVLGALNGCNAPGKPPEAAEAKVPAAAAGPYLGYRRYAGTVGGRPVTVALTFTPAADKKPAGCEGSYFYGRGGQGELSLDTPADYRVPGPLVLVEYADEKETGRWRAAQPGGPVLTGTWTSPTGRQLPFELRETYQDAQGQQMAARYEFVENSAEGPVCAPEADDSAQPQDSTADEPEMTALDSLRRQPAVINRTYVHLLGPDTLRPALRGLQCFGPAQRAAELQEFVGGDGSCMETNETTDALTLNEFGLLSFALYRATYYFGAAHFSHSATATTYDLVNGDELQLADQLRPGTAPRLQKIVTHHLLHDPPGDGSFNPEQWDADQLVPLPDGLGLTYTGMSFSYSDGELPALGVITVSVPYAELVPLLRPGSPVARMLRQRGLWPGAGPKRQ